MTAGKTAESRRSAETLLGLLRNFNGDAGDGEAAGRALGLKPCRRLTFGGVGGSGASADSVSAVYGPRSGIPVRVVKDYFLPLDSTPGDLLFATSYSGDTEETLSLTRDAMARCWDVAVACSGGTMMETARKLKIPVVKMPLGRQPRFAYPYSFGVGKAVLESASGKPLGDLPKVDADWCEEQGASLASEVVGRTPVIISWGPLQSTGSRWANQFAENGKELAFVQELPEMNHNQIVGWLESGRSSSYHVVLLMDDGLPAQIQKRFEATAELLKGVESGPSLSILRLGTEGNPAHGVMESVLIGDFASVYLAMEKGIDPLPVLPISRLKSMMRSKGKRIRISKRRHKKM